MLVDTHAHIYLERFASDFEDVLERARGAGVEVIVMPAIDVPSVRKAIALSDQHAGLYAMSALHPSETKEATDEDFDAVADLCAAPEVVAVGETGLDYYWDRSFDDRQHHFLRRHVRLALETDLPLILHLRDKQGREEVFEDVLRILSEEREVASQPGRMRGIFHCFTGPAWVAEKAWKRGFYLGIGGILTFKNSGLDEALAGVPLERMVLETDAPYLAPAPHRGKRNEPAYTRLIAERLAAVKGVDVDEVERVTTENALNVYGLTSVTPATAS